MSASERLAELNLTLPPVAAPVAAYIPALVDDGKVRTSGQLPFQDGVLVSTGACGSPNVDLSSAQVAARQAALNALAAAAAAAGGLELIESVIKVTGFVSSTPDFYGQPQVVDGASELFQVLFGTPHIRSAVGVAALPLDATVELEVEFKLASSELRPIQN
ncbi:RidA family protein [Actinomyces sp. F1_1611]